MKNRIIKADENDLFLVLDALENLLEGGAICHLREGWREAAARLALKVNPRANKFVGRIGWGWRRFFRSAPMPSDKEHWSIRENPHPYTLEPGELFYLSASAKFAEYVRLTDVRVVRGFYIARSPTRRANKIEGPYMSVIEAICDADNGLAVFSHHHSQHTRYYSGPRASCAF